MRNVAFAACMMSLPLFSACDLDNDLSLLECKMNSVRDDTVYPCRAGARFATGRPFYCGHGFWATGEVLYWTAFEGGTDYAYSSSSTTDTEMIGKVFKTKFDWDVGYRIGFSYSWPQDNWDLSVYFAQINPEAENSVSVEGPSRLGSLFTSSEFTDATNASMNWKTKLSVLDFEYGRQYFVSRYLYLRPHFGVRAGWVHQKANAVYANATANDVMFGRNDFTGAGLRLGSDSKWFFDRHWNLMLNASAAALYGEFKVKNTRTVTTSGDVTSDFDMSESTYKIAPTAHMLLALGWETFFAHENNHLSLSIGYEVNYWWRQNQLVYNETTTAQPYGTRLSDDLGYHGFTFDIQLSF